MVDGFDTKPSEDRRTTSVLNQVWSPLNSDAGEHEAPQREAHSRLTTSPSDCDGAIKPHFMG